MTLEHPGLAITSNVCPQVYMAVRGSHVVTICVMFSDISDLYSNSEMSQIF